VGYRVLVVGGGVSGCEAALYLAEEGREVTIIDEGAAPMPKYSRLPRIALIDLLMAKKVELRTNIRVTGLIPGGATAEDSTGRHLRFVANTVVVANGRRTDEELLRRFSDTADTVTAVGGCRKPGSLLECIHGGYFAGRNIEFY
jgi:2-enoate reductase